MKFSTCCLALCFVIIPTPAASNLMCSTSHERKEVTIIGGGLAGIFAASVLELRGISYNLLESDSKWGGRLRSGTSVGGSTPFHRDPNDPTSDFIMLEEGAQYMYGTVDPSGNRENPIRRLFRNFDIDTFDYDVFSWDTYDEDGDPIEDSLVEDLQGEIVKSVEKCLNKAANKWFQKYAKGKRQTPDEDAESLLESCKGRFAWTNDTPLKTAMSHFFAGEVENALPLDQFGKASFPEDSFDVFSATAFTQFDQEGTSAMVQDLVDANLQDPNSLRQLNTRVIIVDQTMGSTIVTTAEVGGGCETFESDFVIVTVPMNILKGNEPMNMIEFIPGLNIDQHPIDLTIVEKVWVQFSEAFWDDSREWIFVTNELNNGTPMWFFNYNQILPGSNLLLAFVRESQIDDMGGTIVIETVVADLKKLPEWHDGITYSSQVSEWKDDENFSGSWEVWKVGGTYPQFEEAMQPEGNVHKAGAGFCMNFYGFTWGAIFNGIWQAEWVVQRIENGGLGDAPYSPCQDQKVINNRDLRNFYREYGSLFDPF